MSVTITVPITDDNGKLRLGGKLIRNETTIQRGSTSVGSVAVDLAEKIFGDLKAGLFATAFRRAVDRLPTSKNVSWSRGRAPVTLKDSLVFTTMRNEGPFILEWVAWQKMLGFDNVLILFNDCTDRSPQLSQVFGIRSIPTVIAFRNGEPRSEFAGALPEEAVRECIEILRSVASKGLEGLPA